MWVKIYVVNYRKLVNIRTPKGRQPGRGFAEKSEWEYLRDYDGVDDNDEAPTAKLVISFYTIILALIFNPLIIFNCIVPVSVFDVFSNCHADDNRFVLDDGDE